MKYEQTSSETTNKVKAASMGGSVSVAIAEVIIYLIENIASFDIDASIEFAIMVIIVAIGSWLTGWLVRPSKEDTIQRKVV